MVSPRERGLEERSGIGIELKAKLRFDDVGMAHSIHKALSSNMYDFTDEYISV